MGSSTVARISRGKLDCFAVKTAGRPDMRFVGMTAR
jgi:hypothetical protein